MYCMEKEIKLTRDISETNKIFYETTQQTKEKFSTIKQQLYHKK